MSIELKIHALQKATEGVMVDLDNKSFIDGSVRGIEA